MTQWAVTRPQGLAELLNDMMLHLVAQRLISRQQLTSIYEWAWQRLGSHPQGRPIHGPHFVLLLSLYVCLGGADETRSLRQVQQLEAALQVVSSGSDRPIA